MNGVTYIHPNHWSIFSNAGELVIIVTETGRTYAVYNDPFSCYVRNGEYLSEAQNFRKWWLEL